MFIKTDENGYVVAYSQGNGHINGIKYTGTIPEEIELYMNAYKMVDGQLILDENKKAEMEMKI